MTSGDREAGRRTGRPAGHGAPPAMAVLFVDPDVASAERLAAPLRGRYTVAVVPTALAARTAMQHRLPDLVVTELDLPDARGIDLVATLRQGPATRHVLLMAVTRRTSVLDKIAAFQAGCDDVLVKPVGPEQFETHLLLVSRFRQVIRG
jgi:DNA-binding response OmpR family regulator